MFKNLTSPIAAAALLLLAGATAIPTGIAFINEGATQRILGCDILNFGVGILTTGVVFTLFQMAFKIRKWEHFARIKAIEGWKLFLLLNIAHITALLAQIAHVYISLGNEEYLMFGWYIALIITAYLAIATNIIFLAAMPHTKLPAQMALRYTHTSKELNAWRVFFVLLLLGDIVLLTVGIYYGFIMGIIDAAVYLYIIFALHAGKIAWKEERFERKNK